jgi:hypothetical protein
MRIQIIGTRLERCFGIINRAVNAFRRFCIYCVCCCLSNVIKSGLLRLMHSDLLTGLFTVALGWATDLRNANESTDVDGLRHLKNRGDIVYILTVLIYH